jgi:transposase-like protein
VTKNRPAFVNDEAVDKILYSAVRNALEKRRISIRDWRAELNQSAVIFGKGGVPF